MSTISQISSYSRYLGLVRTLNNGQSNVDTLSTQLTTGKKSVDLNAYGPEVQKLLDLRAELAQRDNYVQNIDTASPRVQATDKVLTQLEKLASDWQSSNLMPFNPGPPSVTSSFNADADAMKVSVNLDKSKPMVGSRFTVTAVPSQQGPNGTFDVTVTDGLGGQTTRSINLATVPPNDGGGYNFKISGGPGDGAVLNLNFDKLAAASSSNFTVAWPQADQMRDRAEGALQSIQQLLNERFGDRFLFAGSRYGTEPVKDLMQQQQVSKITLNGSFVNTSDYFEVTVNGKVFGYEVQAADPKTMTFVAQTLTSQINAASPALPITVSTNNGIITFVGQQQDQKFDLSARVVNEVTIKNTASTPATTQTPTTTLPQIDAFTLNGVNVDIGDTFEFSVVVGDPDDPYNQKYYNQYPNEPHDLPNYQKYTYKYTVTDTDYAAGVTDVSQVATKLNTLFTNQSPQPPVSLNVTGSQFQITSNNNLSSTHPGKTSLFTTEAKVTNGAINNTMTVATLPPEADPVMDIPDVEPPNLPFYDTDYLTKRSNPDAYRKSQVTADDGLNVTYGVSSDDQAFQTLIKAFRLARVAATNPGKYDEVVSQSREMMARAQDQVRTIHSKVSSDLKTLDETKTAHKDAMATVTDRIAKIEGVDPTEVAARLSSAMNNLQAAYTVAGQTQKLSLLNYIA